MNKQAQAFELGIVRQLKQAGLDEARQQVVLDIAAQIDDDTSLDDLHTVVVKTAHSRSIEMSEKTAEQVQKEADAFEYGMGLTLKKAGITKQEDVQQFMSVAAALAAEQPEK